jgi:hypothetical protein
VLENLSSIKSLKIVYIEDIEDAKFETKKREKVIEDIEDVKFVTKKRKKIVEFRKFEEYPFRVTCTLYFTYHKVVTANLWKRMCEEILEVNLDVITAPNSESSGYSKYVTTNNQK